MARPQRKKVRKVIDDARRAHGGARRIRSEERVVEWARKTEALLRRLRKRLVEDGSERARALQQLASMRRNAFWDIDDTAPRKAARETLSARNKEIMRRLFDAVSPDIQQAKKHFLLGATVEAEDIAEYVAATPRLGLLAVVLRFEWSVDLVNELCAVRPSDWLVARFADALDKSEQTIKNFLYR